MKSRKPGTFEKGNKLGGKRENAGRPPDWLRTKCQKLLEKHKLIEFVAKVAAGEDIDQAINDNGECLKIPAGVKERLKAVEMLKEWGLGKTPDNVDVEITHRIINVVRAGNGPA
jgi:hypothetical protein